MRPLAEGARVIVTGGSSGLGAAVVERLGRVGAEVVVLDRQPPAGAVPHVKVDLADAADARDAVGEVAGRWGDVDAVVCAAGIDACGLLEEVDWDDWERVVRVNLLGTAVVVQAALPALERAGGRLVTVASTLGLRALSHATAYCASKFGVVGFSRALAVELAGRVGVTMLVPGGMDTAFFDGRSEQFRPPADAALNDPANVAAAVVFALEQPAGCELRELVVCPSVEPSWP